MYDETKCNIEVFSEDFINLMSVEFKKGHFILGAEFNETYNFEMYPDVSTEAGVCKTIKPMVDFNPALSTPKDRDDYKIDLGSEVLSGESNGLTVFFDVETYDHGYVPAKASGISLVVNHHGDKPILNSGRIKLQPGTDTDIQIAPSFTTTDDDAISKFKPSQRKCYDCSEVLDMKCFLHDFNDLFQINMMFLPYKNNNPSTCDNYGYRYSMANCVFESAFEATLNDCNCYPLFHESEYHSKKLIL